MASNDDELLAVKLARERAKKQEEESALDTSTESFASNSSTDYVSPFDHTDDEEDEQEEPMAEGGAEEEEEDDGDPLVENRIKSYFIILAIIYFAFLAFGWKMTSYSGSTPQILTMDIRSQQTYMARIEEYVLATQNLHAEANSIVGQFESKVLGAGDADMELKKVLEKAQKLKTEIDDITPPKNMEPFHMKLKNLVSAVSSFTGAADKYVLTPDEKHASVAKDANEKYSELSTNLLAEQDAFFRK